MCLLTIEHENNLKCDCLPKRLTKIMFLSAALTLQPPLTQQKAPDLWIINVSPQEVVTFASSWWWSWCCCWSVTLCHIASVTLVISFIFFSWLFFFQNYIYTYSYISSISSYGNFLFILGKLPHIISYFLIFSVSFFSNVFTLCLVYIPAGVFCLLVLFSPTCSDLNRPMSSKWQRLGYKTVSKNDLKLSKK